MIRKRNNPIVGKNSFENAAWKGKSVVCGIDEVGRGCLAGPLVTSAVILPPYTQHKLLRDSKQMSQKQLLEAYNWIKDHCTYNVGIVRNWQIDQHNIYNATKIAMKKALAHVFALSDLQPSAILIDAMPLDISDTLSEAIPVYSFEKGESKSTSIAAASIVAKVVRDNLMRKLDPIFPGYHFSKHKGYGTKIHKEAIDLQKHTIMHRLSFLNNLCIGGNHEQKEQLSLW